MGRRVDAEDIVGLLAALFHASIIAIGAGLILYALLTGVSRLFLALVN